MAFNFMQNADSNTLWKSMQDYFSKSQAAAQPAPVTQMAPGQEAWSLMTSGKQFMPNFLSNTDRQQFMAPRGAVSGQMTGAVNAPVRGQQTAPPDSYPAQIAAFIANTRRGRPLS